MNLVNKALRTAFNQCKSATEQFATGGQVPGPGQMTKTWWGALYLVVIPYIVFDVDTHRVTLHTDGQLLDTTESNLFGTVGEVLRGIRCRSSRTLVCMNSLQVCRVELRLSAAV